jgi:hypothetical protein
VRLRRIAAALERAGSADASWFAERLRRYEAEAADGRALDRAFELNPSPGQRSWRTLERNRERDKRLREFRNRWFPNLGVHEAALEMDVLFRRRQASSVSPPTDARGQMVAGLSHFKLPRARRLVDILTATSSRSSL